MTKTRKWSWEIVAEKASQYSVLKDFRINEPLAYNAACKKGWLDDVCAHMLRMSKPVTHLTKNDCVKIARNYTNRKDFRNDHPTLFNYVNRKKWTHDVFSHMARGYRQSEWNDLEKCKAEAKKYKSRTDFRILSKGAYNQARVNGWLDECCRHMVPIGNRMLRAVYEIANHDDKIIYIGLTRNIEKRQTEHRRNSFHLIDIFGEELVLNALTNYIPAKSAAKKESEFVQSFINKGYDVLNRIAAGGLGGRERYWTEDLIRKEALKYKTRTEFFQKSSGAYYAALELGCIDRVCGHMKEVKKPSGYWTDDRIAEEALKYKTRTDFNINARGCYTIAWRRGILNKVCAHMPRRSRNRNKCLFATITQQAS